jgi:hypothetical protein
MIAARLYSTSRVDLEPGEVVFVVARPIYGRHIGYVGTSGFKVMAVDTGNPAHMEEARVMDAQLVQLADANFEQGLLDAHEYADEYRALIDEGTITLRRVAVDCGWTHIDITPVESSP